MSDKDLIHNTPPESFGSIRNETGRRKFARLDVIATADDNVNLTEPSSQTHSEYPHNKVEKSISGHIREIDDTAGAERIFEMHKSGTFYEIHPDGSKVTKVFGKDWSIVFDDDNLIIGGNRNITINGNCNLLVKGNVKQKIGGNLETIVTGDMITRVSGRILQYVKGDIDIQSRKNIRTRSKLNTNIVSKNNLGIESKGNLTILSKGLTTIFSQADMFIEGHDLHFNEYISAPASIDIGDKDSKYGLQIPDSLIEPNIDILYNSRTDNDVLTNSIDNSKSYPRNRIKSD